MNLKPFRIYAETDVLNFFTFLGGSANKGSFVTVVGSGLNFADNLDMSELSAYSFASSPFFAVPWNVRLATSGEIPVGMLRNDVRTVDENGYPLIFEHRKAAENEWTISGQAVPIVTKGVFLAHIAEGTPAAGSGLAVANATAGGIKVTAPDVAGSFGKFLGPKDADGYAVIKFDCK